MALSNTAVPKYYGAFREAVLRREIPVCKKVALEMARIDELIANPGVYYDDNAVEGWIKFCENELTLVDGTDLHLLDTFKLWGEQVFGWYYFVDRSVYEPDADGHGGHYVVGQARVARGVAGPAVAVEDADTGIGGNPFAVGAVHGQVENEVAQQTAVIGCVFLPVVTVESHQATEGDAYPGQSVLVDDNLLDKFHLQSTCDIVVLGPGGAVPFDDTIVVGTNP